MQQKKLPSQISDATTSLDPHILDIMRAYEAACLPKICVECDGIGSVRKRTQRFGAVYLATSFTITCPECGGWGVTWFKP